LPIHQTHEVKAAASASVEKAGYIADKSAILYVVKTLLTSSQKAEAVLLNNYPDNCQAAGIVMLTC